MKRNISLAILLCIFSTSAFAYNTSFCGYEEEENLITSRSSKNQILQQAGCKAIKKLSNGRWRCVRY
ncbi:MULTISPECIES: hypothetical protein [unclassified Campylobacter]|uniref:hypothetical protein n=1 Tax=unclassified Campylobacter TaxID=2593542 RepID=UPI0012382776|nr:MULTISPECIES: hypothetical protein [unclassified Campylobacter]KAA6224570.1 hypothetical protein FMM54_08255 [Campylobacter sp. LR185c]KAA6224917.1 hypothetical protein FMM55_08445 [Campylobacter sp. LR196d]KAA6225414.1 hypothetical protein FMM57_07710 [Campylobacter sp. LR286c]KAA6229118.1 hypothetical protein FMM58_08475 [Campylobacter sp. LR291e]KAA6229602.1 hypothetical protein FMM56_07735 [Campylobacter sp. LR264d]